MPVLRVWLVSCSPDFQNSRCHPGSIIDFPGAVPIHRMASTRILSDRPAVCKTPSKTQVHVHSTDCISSGHTRTRGAQVRSWAATHTQSNVRRFEAKGVGRLLAQRLMHNHPAAHVVTGRLSLLVAECQYRWLRRLFHRVRTSGLLLLCSSSLGCVSSRQVALRSSPNDAHGT